MRAPAVLIAAWALAPLCVAGYGSNAPIKDVAGFLQKEGRRLKSAELLQLAHDARYNPAMDKVKDMISHMIAQHMTAQAEDTDRKGFCDKEVAESKKKLARLSTDLDKKKADTDMQSAKLDELKDSITDMHEEISKAHTSKQKAMDIRKQEEEAYAELVRNADAAIASARMEHTKNPDYEKAREALEKVEVEMSDKKIHAENKEQEAQFKYKKLMQELDEAVAAKTKEVENKEHQVVRDKHDLVIADGDIKSLEEELAASKDYEEKIKSSCTVGVEPHKERARRREEEISNLKEAYGMLNGETIPVLG
eukprot:gnl/MRDRNA2_/MRDRNA2_94002_c0_seq1.p1 gnl/MRDRNA2_/MRDRNA2_94002_c0~~gnl/MRDRNA2_/MRDRNA2_94002_c0_seq1.p1  ORF type:complete len:308 (+),score=116.91 gnl/MRDRNA2_/MRDRNA2_94002_c0_seq1:57-980(+)